MFDLPPPTHWLDNGTVACGAKLTRDQHATRTLQDDSKPGHYVTCPKCIAAIRRRVRQLADQSTEAEEVYVRQLQRMLSEEVKP